MKKLLALFALLLPAIALADSILPIVSLNGAINLSWNQSRSDCNTASVNACVAPLGVFFDASGTTAPTFTSKPFHHLIYTWNFGDNDTLTWSTGTQPGVSKKNRAVGPEAAHVYETPGTYVACLMVTTSDLTAVTGSCQTIFVTDPEVVFAGAGTVCCSAVLPVAGVGGCPVGASVFSGSDFITVINSNKVAHKRMLLNRGETFTHAGAGAILALNGPGIVGAYGTGAKPIIQQTVNSSAGQLALASSGVTANDWRIMDLTFDGNGNTNNNGISATGGAIGGINRTVFLRLTGINSNKLINFADTTLPYDDMHMVELNGSAVVGTSGYGCGFIAGKRLSLIGSVCDASAATGVHSVRFPHTERGYVAYNTWTSGTFTCLDFLGQTVLTGRYSELVEISDNDCSGANSQLSIRPQNSSTPERIRNVIIERNFVHGVEGSGGGIIVSAQLTTTRNNIVLEVGGANRSLVIINRRGVEPLPDQNEIYGNAMSTPDVGANFIGLTIDPNITATTAQNNACWAPNDSNHVCVSGTGTSPGLQGNNSTTPQTLSNNPFSVLSPASPIDFKAANYAVGGGVSVIGLTSDFFGLAITGTPDIGAVRH